MGRGCAVHSLIVRRPCRFGQQPRTWLPRNNSFAGDRAALPISESGLWLVLFAQPLRPRTTVTDPHVLLVACVPPQAPQRPVGTFPGTRRFRQELRGTRRNRDKSPGSS